MTKLQQLIKELCPNGATYQPLEKCCEILDGKRKPITKAVRELGEYPYYGANGIQDYVSNYLFDGEFVLVGEDGSVLTEKGTPVVNWAEGKIWVNNHAHVIKGKEEVLLRFVYYYLQLIDITNYVHGNIPKFTGRDFKALLIPVLPLPVQEEIVRILDELTEKTDELISELKAELDERKKQYEHYKNKLMSVESANIFKLGDIAFICDGTHQTPHYTDSGVKFISVENINDILNTTKYISKEDYDKYKVKPQIGDVFMTRIGSIGKCAVLDKEEDLAYYVTLALIRPNQNIVISKYLKYVIESMVGAKELRKRTLLNAVPIKINKDDIGKIELPIPSINSQEKIVAQIEKYDIEFDMLIRSISNEIENRKKQYEYYRDNLLTF